MNNWRYAAFNKSSDKAAWLVIVVEDVICKLVKTQSLSLGKLKGCTPTDWHVYLQMRTGACTIIRFGNTSDYSCKNYKNQFVNKDTAVSWKLNHSNPVMAHNLRFKILIHKMIYPDQNIWNIRSKFRIYFYPEEITTRKNLVYKSQCQNIKTWHDRNVEKEQSVWKVRWAIFQKIKN